MAKAVKTRRNFNVVCAELEYQIAASRPRVWKSLVDQIDQWWPRDFVVGARVRRLVLEPRLGGRLYEDWGDGAGLTWYTVESIDPPNLIEWKGRLSKDFGGPAMQLVELRLESAGKGTRLRLSDTVFGAIDAAGLSTRLGEGWSILFEKSLKPFAEGKARARKD